MWYSRVCNVFTCSLRINIFPLLFHTVISFTSLNIFRSSQCSTTGVTKAVVCVILSVVCVINIKEPLLLIGKSSPCGGNRFPLSLSEWSFTICLMPYNHKSNVLSSSLNKTFPSFVPSFIKTFYKVNMELHSLM